VQTSHPPWLVQRWLDRLGPQQAERALLAHNQPAPLVLRVNRRRTDAGALRTRLEAEGVQTEPGGWSDDALHVSEGNPLAGDAFREGLFYVQGEASILVADLVGAQPGERIADLCAAPGGKATQLAAVLQARGLLLACDLQPRRLGLVRDNARRLGLDPIRLVVHDAGQPAIRPGSLDRALLDAPCSGTGVLRRHPEIRWRRELDDVRRLASLQARLLDAAARTVRPGGRLVYSVCSLEPEEGPEVVQRFLQRRPDYHIDEPGDVPEALVDRSSGLPCLRTHPQRHGLDGFFAAVLQRDPS
jgi:16S rRNA (cytosine967-C5)-methyltransferase